MGRLWEGTVTSMWNGLLNIALEAAIRNIFSAMLTN